MGAAVTLGNVVGKGQDRLVVTVVPPHRDLDADPRPLAHHVDRLGHHRLLRPVKILDELAHPAIVEKLGPQGFGMALVFKNDANAGIQEGKFPQTGFQNLEAVVEVREGSIRSVGLGAAKKAHFGATHTRRRTHFMHMNRAFSVLEPGAILGVIPPDGQLQPLRQRVDDRHPHAMQTARHLVSVAAFVGVVELSAGVKLGHDHFGGGNPFLGVDIHRDAAPVVPDRDGIVGVDFHRDGRGMSRQSLVNAVVHDLIDHMVQARAVIGIADVHPRAFADGLQPLENLDRIRAVFAGLLRLLGHACPPVF